MAYQWATWLADVLEDAGCTVVREPGWETRGRPDGSFTPRGIMLHHDASPTGSTSSGVDVIRDGRPGLEGPLAQLWLDYYGAWHVVAAGRANHAGEGQFGDIPRDQGNEYCIGIETDHTTDEAWTAGQRSEALRGVAALADHLGIRTPSGLKEWFCAHKEWTDRKVDPDPLEMDRARDQLLAYQPGGVLGMTDVTAFSRDTDQNVSSPDTWKTLRLDDEGDGALSLLTGPAQAYMAVTSLTLTGLPPGKAAQFRYVKVIDYPDDRDTVVEVGYPIQEITGTDGHSYGQLVWANNLGGPTDDDGLQKLRVQALAPDAAYVVSRIVSRVLT